MLTLDAAWLAAMKQSGARLVHVVTITIGGGVTLKARRGWSDDTTIQSYPGSLETISPLTANLDPHNRKFQLSQYRLTFAADGWMKSKSILYRLRGKAISVVFGEASNTEAQMAPRFGGVIERAIPSPDGSVELVCRDVLGVLNEHEIQTIWAGKHAMEVIEEEMVSAGVPAAMYDAASFSPAGIDEVSHWNIYRDTDALFGADMLSMIDPEKATTRIEEMCQMLNAAFLVGEDGVASLSLFDAAASVQDTWTEADVDPDSVEVVEVDDNVVNRVIVNYGVGGPNGAFTYVADDTGSQAAFAYPGETSRVISDEISLKYADARAMLFGTISASHPTTNETLTVYGYSVFGFAGARWPGFKSGSQPADAQLSTARTCYLRIDDEIIECKAAAVNTSEVGHVFYKDLENGVPTLIGTVSEYKVPQRVVYTVVQRGALGTTAASHLQPSPTVKVQVYDVTVPVAMAKARLERFAYGAPIIRVRTSLAKYALQIADFVRYSTDKCFSYGKADTSDIVWEIIGKEVDVDGDSVGITWTLCQATETSPPAKVFVERHYDKPASAQKKTFESNIGAKTFVPVAEGYAKQESGLDLTIGAGAHAVGQQQGAGAEVTLTLEASKDHYVYVDAMSGQKVVHSVAIGDPAPPVAPTAAPLYKVTTGASSFTASKDLRKTNSAVRTTALNQDVKRGSLMPNSNFSDVDR